MNAYIDTSALLRLILREPNALPLSDVTSCDVLVSSELLAVEAHRTIDRLRLQGALAMEEAIQRAGVVRSWLEAIDLVLLRPPVLARASEPFPTPIGALDAIHLATALLWRAQPQRDLTMMTHDSGLAEASRAFGIQVLGV